MIKMFKRYIILSTFIALFTLSTQCINWADLSIHEDFFSGDLSWAQNNQAEIRYNFGGNNAIGRLFLLETIDNVQNIILSGDSISCNKQIRWFFWNSSRWNRIRPLDAQTLQEFRNLDSSYDWLTLSGGLFTDCDNGWSEYIYGAVKHSWLLENFWIVAGVDYDFLGNSYNHHFENNLSISPSELSWYWFDSYWGIGQLNWTGLTTCDITWIGDITTVCSTETLTQSNACGQTRVVNWTKYCLASNWWGWWTTNRKKDSCPDWDYSPSYYDRTCWSEREKSEAKANKNASILEKIKQIALEEKHKSPPINTCDTKRVEWYSQEILDAFEFAYSKQITTQCPISDADMGWTLIRKHLAKMISEYAIQEVWKKPDTNKVCVFKDIQNESSEMKKYAILACQLWLMGIDWNWNPNENFNPNEKVTRAMFWTAFSRLLYWDRYNKSSWKRRTFHLEALRINWIMSKIDTPNDYEQRGYTMLMFMRSASK